MKHFRLNLFVSIFLLTITAGGIAAAVIYRNLPVGLLLFGVWMVAVIWMVSIMRRPVKIVSSFAKAIDEADTTARIPMSDDAELNEMAITMNHLADVHRDALKAIETRTLYYDRILRIMTHEMRNSIAPVISLSSDLAERLDSYDKSDIVDAATLISSQSRSIKKFLDSYYELTHLPQPEIVQVDGMSFFSSIQKIATSYAAEHNIPESALSFTIARNLRFDADAELLSRALINIIRNAVDATEEIATPSITVTAGLLNNALNITIADNGHGISPAASENLFMPFFTTKKKGSGIGLCLSRQIARLHGGDLTLLSAARGTTAIFVCAQKMAP